MNYTTSLKADYEAKWARMKITREAQAKKVADLILKGKARYEATSRRNGGRIPWEFIGLTHYREAACDWRGVLHNGEKIVGTNKKTRLVPAGYGPFATWEDAADSALRRQGLDKETDWSIGKMAYRLEGFNGYGYHSKGVPSPYLWGGSNIYSKGKYVQDHIFDPEHIDQQMGCMPVLSLLLKQAPQEVDRPPPVSTPETKPPSLPEPVKKGGVAALVAAGLLWLQTHGVWIAVGVLGAIVLYVLIRTLMKMREKPLSPKADDPSELQAPESKTEVANTEPEEGKVSGEVVSKESTDTEVTQSDNKQ